MARSTAEIKAIIVSDFISKPEIIAKYSLIPGQTFEQQFSLVSFENILFSIIAFALSFHEKIVEANAENSRPHNVPWYREQAFAFLDGLELVWNGGFFGYDLTGIDDVEDRKIIDRCAVLESNDGELVFKIATNNNGEIEPLSPPQLLRFKEYMNLIKDGGNQLRIINESADLLRVTLTVFVDPLIIDLETGKLLNTDEDVYPVEQAIEMYLENLEFNGAFVKEFFKDAIKTAPGVKLPTLNDVQWKYATFPFAPIPEWKVPEAGYFKIMPEDLTINYAPYDLA